MTILPIARGELARVVVKAINTVTVSVEMVWRYTLPFVLYLLGTNLLGFLPEGGYAIGYAMVVVVVGAATTALLWKQRILVPHGRLFVPVAVGVVGIAVWIALCDLQLERYVTDFLPSWLQPGERRGFDPHERTGTVFGAWSFVVVRLLGLAVLVPVAEELFWRGFLLRWLVSDKWREVETGRFTFRSFAIVTLLFTAAHPEWFAAAAYCALLNGLLYWKKDLWDCVVAHGVSNLLLGLYVLTTENWWLW